MKKLVWLLLSLCCMQFVSAQRLGFAATYSIAFPSGDLNDFIGETSFRGVSLELNRRQKPNLDIGIEAGWNVFYEKVDRKAFTEGTASISGVQFRYTNTVPILAHARYYHGVSSGKKAVPFAGLGIGTIYVDRYVDIGLYRITTDTWQFCMRPEIGFAFKGRNTPAGTISARYYAGFGNDELDGQSYFSINIGILFSGL